MARPIKKGLVYFPLDVDIFDDFKILDLLEKYGGLGFCVYQYVLCQVYKNGYYLDCDIEKLSLLTVRAIGNKWIKRSVAAQVICYLADIGLLDKDLLSRNIITSVAIQRRYSEVVKRNKTEKGEYWLLDDFEQPLENTAQKTVSATETHVSVTKTPVSVTEMQQSKEKKTKEKKIKESYGTFKNVLLTPSEYEDVFSWDNGATLNRFSEKLKSKGYKYQDHYAALLQWKAEDTPEAMPEHQRSYDMSEFERRANELPVYKGADNV